MIVPALADFVGDFATVITAHFSTMFYTGKKLNLRNWRHDPEVMDLLVNVFKVSMICALVDFVPRFFFSSSLMMDAGV